jgi:hypothetical protein
MTSPARVCLGLAAWLSGGLDVAVTDSDVADSGCRPVTVPAGDDLIGMEKNPTAMVVPAIDHNEHTKHNTRFINTHGR